MSVRRRFFRLLLPLISAIFAVALVELFLTLFYPIPYSLEKNMYFEPDPYTGYRHRPLGKGFYPNGIAAEANSLGFRDDEVSKAKPAGVFRILALGDSFTVGANVEQSEAYPQVLERILDTDGRRNIEIINAGVGGYDSFHYGQFVEHYAAQYEPDMILLGFFSGNDAYSQFKNVEQTRTAVLGRRIDRNAGKGWSLLLKVWGYENLHVVRALLNTGPANIQFERESCDQFADYYLAVQEKRLVNHLATPTAEQQGLIQANFSQLRRIQRIAADQNIKFGVVLLPDENQLNIALQKTLIPDAERDQYDFDMPQASLRTLLGQAQISYLDLLPDFRADSRCLYMDDTHWVAAGHEMAAQRIAAWLKASDLLH